MTKTARSEPWHALRPELADAIEPELREATEEILATIAREVPEYARPLEGAFGVAIRTGVSEALRQFVALIRDPEAGRDPGRDVYVGLGRGELREGRTLDALQSAYRVGARAGSIRRPGGRAGRLAPGLGGRSQQGRRPGGARAARRGDLRLHRRALGRFGGGLRAGAARAGG